MRCIVKDFSDVQRIQLLANHSKPAPMEPLHTHQVERPVKGGGHVAIPGVLVLSPYQYPIQKALSKDGIILLLENLI